MNRLGDFGVETYGPTARGNYGTHCLSVRTPDFTVWYSYETIVAVAWRDASARWHRLVAHNDWGPTTGKHINAIDGGSQEAKADRVPQADVQAQVDKLVAAHRNPGKAMSDEELVAEVEARGLAWERGGRDFYV
jgi:hypothetical protein